MVNLTLVKGIEDLLWNGSATIEHDERVVDVLVGVYRIVEFRATNYEWVIKYLNGEIIELLQDGKTIYKVKK
jgi:hypothetical protein